MKKSVYKSAMSHLKTSENFQEATYNKLMKHKETMNMELSKKRKVIGWTVGIAACAALAVGIITLNQDAPASTPSSQPTTSVMTKPPTMGKMAVNIDGIISEVCEDGKSFKVGELWVDVTDQTKLGSSEPTAAKPSDELLQKKFEVGDIVSGYTSQDVSTGKVTADVIYNLIAPEKEDEAQDSEAKPAVQGKVAVNIDGVISEVSEDGNSFKVGDLWVTVTQETKMGIDGPTTAAPSEELLQKEFKVGNIVSGFTTDDVSTGKVNATNIYNNMAPQQ
ncbi:hypothetical protein DFQ01_11197 [Paenibacillus cellulosilyticus]|uniref:DUF5666 domain-containing protein n=1 Tax=Paenibacillus cellulosilyticus TaxID=375489 RepID=A0A2V2YSB5_9BACL|nr:hypothetical protein [Paenibacillus cellulosilyticus]PWW00950.1 hypothetical protein DFQ01_11197 [Paenibacillus cellulosilyticus]QKS47598.1 hypothetical protein HUB94_24820 [Paenibacillus cellulosilyticus]